MATTLTPERSAYLVSLFQATGYRCIEGHYGCLNVEHYIHVVPIVGEVPIDRRVPAIRPDGTPQRDADGHILYTIVHRHRRGVLRTEKRLTSAYDIRAERVQRYWSEDDRADAHFAWLRERDLLHDREPRTIRLGRFGTIPADIWRESQPLYYLEQLGMSGITFTPFAIVKLPSSSVRLHVDLGDTLRGVSKNRRRKMIRYGKSAPSVRSEIARIVSEAVTAWHST